MQIRSDEHEVERLLGDKWLIKADKEDIWLQSQRLGVQFPTVPPEKRASLCGPGPATLSPEVAAEKGNYKPLLSTPYLENPEKD